MKKQGSMYKQIVCDRFEKPAESRKEWRLINGQEWRPKRETEVMIDRGTSGFSLVSVVFVFDEMRMFWQRELDLDAASEPAFKVLRLSEDYAKKLSHDFNAFTMAHLAALKADSFLTRMNVGGSSASRSSSDLLDEARKSLNSIGLDFGVDITHLVEEHLRLKSEEAKSG